MDINEKKRTGLSKLSDKEKGNLLSWIDQYYVKRTEPLAAKETTSQKSMLTENLQNGHYIRLADKSTWNIRPQDVPITQGWITSVDIAISQSGDPSYPYKLTNTLSGSSVLARRVDKAPQETPAPPPAPAPSKPSSKKST
jgi:hypothetical protein